MTRADDAEMAGSKKFARVQTPRDSATLIIVRRDGRAPRILLGQRAAHHAFMPGKYVFPGGRYDPADGRMKAARDLAPSMLEKLMHKMRGRPSAARARGLALAAIRETYEEVGLIVGSPGETPPPPSMEWGHFCATGHAPDLAGLTFFARAITPPGRTRRFDSRFFLIEAERIANLDSPHHAGSGELLTPHWFTYEETKSLDLPLITIDILGRLNARLARGEWPEGPECFQHQIRGQWVEERY